MTLKALREAWLKFWFEPKSPLPVALFRIMFGWMVMDTAYHWWADFYLYYGDYAMFPVENISQMVWKNDPKLDLLLLLPPGDNWKVAFFGLFVAAAFCLMLGLFTRLSALIVFFSLITLQTQVPYNKNGGDHFEIIMAFLLSISRAGDALSIDNLIRTRKQDWRVVGLEPQLSPGWSLRLMQVQFCICYCHTFFSKLSGELWVSGIATYYTSRFNDFRRFALPDFLDNIIVWRILSWGTLIIEGSLWWMVWIKELRYWILLLGLAFHMGIEITMNIPCFEGLFMSMYVLWIDPADLRKVMNWIKAKITAVVGAPSVVAYDGRCIFCVRCSGLIQRLDVFGRLHFVDFRTQAEEVPGIDLNRAEKEMLVKTKNDWLGGFHAFRFMARHLPMMWLVVPFLYLPFASVIGKQAYNFIATRRNLLVDAACTGNLCYSTNKGVT